MPRLFLSLVVVSCLAIPAIVNADDAKDHFTRGTAWFDKGEYEKAIAEYNQAMQLLDPNDPNAAAKSGSVYFNRGKALNHKGENDKAIADYNEALRLYPSDAMTYNGRGIAWSDKGEYDKALADYNQALRLLDSSNSPLIATVCCNRGVVWEKTGEYDKAIADYNQALRCSIPRTPTALPSYTIIAATSGTERTSTTRPSRITTEPWRSIPSFPTPTPIAAASGEKGASTAKPLPTTINA